jgi:glyoxylase-like metal-dependent hydrolase (beta-lactamase superfamily II)
MQKTIHIRSLSLEVEVFGTVSTIHPTLLWDEDGATLVDTGFPGTFPQLKQAIERITPLNQMKHIILTHQDWDHIGSVPDILQERNGQVKVLAHAEEKPYLEGSIPHYKLTPERIAARVQALPEALRENASITLSNLPKFQVDYPMTDGEILPFHGGIKVIHVPGHTPGNVSLYIASHHLLIAGDQLRVDNGILVGPAPEHTPDMSTALQSLKKLLPYEIDTILCFHGGTYTSNAAVRIKELAST